jgi:hypothetical protein
VSIIAIACTNALQILCAAIIVLLQRYLLGLSTWKQDRLWLERQTWYNELRRLRFYRGPEYMHQVRAKRLLSDATVTA